MVSLYSVSSLCAICPYLQEPGCQLFMVCTFEWNAHQLLAHLEHKRADSDTRRNKRRQKYKKQADEIISFTFVQPTPSILQLTDDEEEGVLSVVNIC